MVMLPLRVATFWRLMEFQRLKPEANGVDTIHALSRI